MDLASSQAFFWLAFGVAVFAVAAFICWVLYEVAKLLRQSNEIVEHTREVASEVEQGMRSAKERFGESFGTVVGLAKGIGAVTGFAKRHGKDSAAKKKTKKRFNNLTQEMEEVEDEE